MITLEIGQLYGMNSIKEVLAAVKELQDSGMSDADIQAVLDRSKDSTCKGWGGEGMTKEENLRWLNQEIHTWENECQSKHPIKEALYAARKALEQEPCEDAVSRDDVVRIVQHNNPPKALEKIRKLSSVTPQEPKTGYISIDDVMSVFDDFMCGEVDEEGTETFWEMLKDKAESEG